MTERDSCAYAVEFSRQPSHEISVSPGGIIRTSNCDGRLDTKVGDSAMNEENCDLARKMGDVLKDLETALGAVQVERRNLILECKEVRRFKDDLDNERRALFRERRELTVERNQLASTRSGLESTLRDLRALTDKLLQEPSDVKRIVDSIATLQRSLTHMRLDMVQLGQRCVKKNPISDLNVKSITDMENGMRHASRKEQESFPAVSIQTQDNNPSECLGPHKIRCQISRNLVVESVFPKLKSFRNH